jgi:uncharacterized protein YndB with AHSA1/START domain
MTENTNIAARTFTAERIFSAPREKVFAAYTDCRHLMHWWGPREWPLAHCDMDFREGGSWHYAMRETATGNESWGLMLFDEIIAPELIRYRDVFSDASRAINTELPETQATIVFHDEGAKTRVVVNSVYESEETLKQVLDMGMEAGFAETWDRLEEYLTR